MQAIRNVVAAEFDAVNALINRELVSSVPLVEDMGHYIVDAGGKRIRPLLALLSAGAVGRIDESHHRLAAVIEFIHTATLLHDDVVDLSDLRRGLPTANAKWGNAPSVLVGDFIYSRAFQLMVTMNNMPLMGLLSATTNEIAEGEVLQLTLAGNPATDEDTYDRVIRSKTAVLFAAACEGAALLSGAEDRRQCLQQYGLDLGMAFQIADDILDYRGDPETTGKNIGDDLAEGKPTLPLIQAMRSTNPKGRALIETAIRDKSAAGIAEVIAVINDCGALEYCQQRAQTLASRARTQAESLADTPYRQALITLTEMAVERSH